ncbi:DHH family phosphoesterase [Candidatus Micrarchaeota archaeon]|nr:DHH family phosphoesterase [Candidatus Micrarchaeota archaeon]
MGKENPRDAFQRFLSSCKGKKIAIATHSRADVDSLASAFAISRLLPGSVICTSEEMGEGARMLAEKAGIRAEDITGLDKKKFDGLIVVDTSAYTLLPEAKGWKLLCIIDHHRSEGRDMKAEFEIVDSDAPSASEIVAALLPSIDKDVAFALCTGIIADGARFKSARANTFTTLGRLMDIAKADYHELLEIAEPEQSQEGKIAVLTAMKRVEFIYSAGYVIATSEVGSKESDAASLIVEAADVAFVANWKNETKETRISARAGKSVKVQLNKVMSAVADELGGAGGGHAKAAGASLKARSQDALKACVETFIKFAEESG